MKVVGTGPTSNTSGTKRARPTGKPGEFSKHLDGVQGEAEVAGSIDGMAPVAGMDALLAVQSADAATDREARRRLVRRGEDILDRLEELRRGLILGRIEPSSLQQLAAVVRTSRARTDDPRLSAVLDEIELRAEVEIAKFTMRAPAA